MTRLPLSAPTTMIEIEHVIVRNLALDDYIQLRESMITAYPDFPGAYWTEDQIGSLIEKFPQGQLVIEADDQLVGCALSLIVDRHAFGDDHTYREITGNFTFDTHDAEGNVLYGIDVFLRPEYRGLRLGRRLYDARKELCEELNLEAILFGGRLPRYKEHSASMKPKEFIQRVTNKEIHDPVLSFQLSNDFHVRRVLTGYLPGDTSSQDYAALMEWINIYHKKDYKVAGNKKSVVRIGLVQWQMRPFKDIEALFEQIEFFVDAISGYQSDFGLFPELFNAPLMAQFNHLPPAEAIRGLAGYTEAIRDRFKTLAISYNINLIAGSMPLVEDGKLYNVGYLCHRSGKIDMYRKLHITPNEVFHWGMSGGNDIQVFDTDCGKIGIVVCYDVEFPELPRLLADDGMKILFVPFLTDTQNGFTRIQRCSQARAIENECYVAIAGSVGNLPKVNNMDIQFAQSAVFTPADFAFPINGTKSEATPNAEMTLLVDVDLDLLKELHNYGSVKIMKDRRLDLYQLKRVEKKPTPPAPRQSPPAS